MKNQYSHLKHEKLTQLLIPLREERMRRRDQKPISQQETKLLDDLILHGMNLMSELENEQLG